MQTYLKVSELLEGAFLAVCERENTTPEAVLEACVRQHVANYLRLTAENEAGMGPAREFRTDLFARFLAESGERLRAWPYTDTGEPESFEAAECQAKQHGVELAAMVEAAEHFEE